MNIKFYSKKLVIKYKNQGIINLVVACIKYPLNYKKRQIGKRLLTEKNIGERFRLIYQNNLWSSKESGSGQGSELGYTAPLRAWMIQNLPTLNIARFVDAPCGDFNWMKEVQPHLNVEYIGLDIVESVIQINRKLYGSEQIRFEVANICHDRIPDCDVIMVRDCLFHLSFADINSFLENLSRCDYKFLFTTTHLVGDGFKNEDIATGDFRKIDIFAPPFNFDESKVTCRVDDYPDLNVALREMVLIPKQFVSVSLQGNKVCNS